MSDVRVPTARENGWRGFENAGSVEKVPGGWEYRCDGMPTMMGCGETTTITRKYARVGTKKSGWYVCHGIDDDGKPEPDVVLVFGPKCAAIVKEQEHNGTP